VAYIRSYSGAAREVLQDLHLPWVATSWRSLPGPNQVDHLLKPINRKLKE
jgi:hypothetical protein